jgi:hypothetical protein
MSAQKMAPAPGGTLVRVSSDVERPLKYYPCQLWFEDPKWSIARAPSIAAAATSEPEQASGAANSVQEKVVRTTPCPRQGASRANFSYLSPTVPASEDPSTRRQIHYSTKHDTFVRPSRVRSRTDASVKATPAQHAAARKSSDSVNGRLSKPDQSRRSSPQRLRETIAAARKSSIFANVAKVVAGHDVFAEPTGVIEEGRVRCLGLTSQPSFGALGAPGSSDDAERDDHFGLSLNSDTHRWFKDVIGATGRSNSKSPLVPLPPCVPKTCKGSPLPRSLAGPRLEMRAHCRRPCASASPTANSPHC